MVLARPPLEWQPETLDLSKGTVIWKQPKGLYGLRRAPRRWQDHLESALRKSVVSPQTCWTRACGGHTRDEVSIPRIPRGRLAVGWNAPDHRRSPH